MTLDVSDESEKDDVFGYITNKIPLHRPSVQFGKAIVIEKSLDLEGETKGFTGENKVRYLSNRFEKTIAHLRRIGILGGCMVAFFGVVDMFSGEIAEEMLAIYGVLLIYTLIFIWSSLGAYFEKICHVASVGYLILLGLYVCLSEYYMRQNYESFTKERFILVTLFNYAFIGIDPHWILGCGLTSTAAYCTCLVSLGGSLFGEYALWVCCANLVGGMAIYSAERHMKKDYVLRDLIEMDKKTCQLEKAKSDRLLQSILPTSILEKLKSDPKTVADSFNHASVMFCEVHNFDELASSMTPKQVFDLLGEIFNQFDELVSKHGLEKIKTIGETYMVVGGVPNESPRHVHMMAELALCLLDLTKHEFKVGESFKFIEIRIGISCGPAVAGIIGTKKWTYDVWGDVVNVASRMKTTAETNMIQVSGTAADIVAEEYTLSPRENVFVKGKGYLTTFVLLGRKEIPETNQPHQPS